MEWIKFYQKIKDNELMRDPVALQLFIWAMANADENGEVFFSRLSVARELRVNPNTLYSALERVVSKYKCVSKISTTTHTKIRLTNWDKYQSIKSTINNETTAYQQRDNTIYKTKNIYIQLTANQKKKLQDEYPTLNVSFELEKFTAWQKANGKEFKNSLERFRLWLMDCVEKQKTPSKTTQTRKTNPILTDPVFDRYKEIFHKSDDVAVRAKMALLPKLEERYPNWKHAQDWEEANKILKSIN